MSFLKEICIDFVLFSFIEAFVFCLFFEKIGNCKSFKTKEIIILGIINSITSTILPPLLFQFIGLFYMAIWIFERDKFNFNISFKISMSASILLLVVESLILMLIETIGIIITKDVNYILFLFLKGIEIIIIEKWGEKMKWWFGEIEKPIKK